MEFTTIEGFSPCEYRPFKAFSQEAEEPKYLGEKITINVNGVKKVVDYDGKIAGNALLTREQWKAVDSLLGVARVPNDSTVGLMDLYGNNLVTGGNFYAKSEYEYSVLSRGHSINIGMDAENLGVTTEQSKVVRKVPLPLVWGDYKISDRFLAQIKATDDISMLDQENLLMLREDMDIFVDNMLFNGATRADGTAMQFNGAGISGYLNTSYKTSMSYNDTLDWANASKTQESILDDCRALKAKVRTNRRTGKFMMYIPASYEPILDRIYTPSGGNTDKTMWDMIRQTMGSQMIDIKISAHITSNKIVYVEMGRSNVVLAEGFAPTLVQWQNDHKFRTHHFKLVGLRVPIIKDDFDSLYGLWGE
jgi:hypothetical protein